MDKSKIDWSKAPEGTTHFGPSGGGFRACWYKNESGVFYFKPAAPMEDEIGNGWLRSQKERTDLIENPAVVPAIKSLEDRIKARAIAALADDVEEEMRHLTVMSLGSENSPSGVGELTIRQLIDAVGAAIMKARSPVVADIALERALDRLSEQATDKRFMSIGTIRV